MTSRYYDPETGRFIIMDNSISGIGADFSGKNVFVYCGNDPINKIDPDGHSWKDIKSWIEEKWNSVKNTVKKIIKPIYDVYYNATKWHFEERIKKNQNIPAFSIVEKESGGWKKLSFFESLFHNNWKGKAEEKYVNSDGREAVFDGDTHELITDPRIAGTYNYSSPYSLTENPTIDDYKRYTTSRVKHFVLDLYPYLITGASNTREQFEEKMRDRIVFWLLWGR